MSTSPFFSARASCTFVFPRRQPPSTSGREPPMYRAFVLLAFLICLGFAVSAPAQVSPPADGASIPPDAIRNDKSGKFELKHAWIAKAGAAREQREQFI